MIMVLNVINQNNTTTKPLNQNRMRTAVEWLEKKIKEFNTVITKEYLLILIEQAKEIEKEQIMEAWFDGTTNWDSESSSEQYYNETFKSE
jgi:hypothetical protein